MVIFSSFHFQIVYYWCVDSQLIFLCWSYSLPHCWTCLLIIILQDFWQNILKWFAILCGRNTWGLRELPKTMFSSNPPKQFKTTRRKIKQYKHYVLCITGKTQYFWMLSTKIATVFISQWNPRKSISYFS